VEPGGSRRVMLPKMSVTSTRRGTLLNVMVMSPELLLHSTSAADMPVTTTLPNMS
jgi:hypothetical protein